MASQEQGDLSSVDWDDLEVPNIYRSTVGMSFTRHVQDVHALTENILPSTSQVAKKRLREFINKHTNDLLAFLGPDQDTLLQRAHASITARGGDVPAPEAVDSGLDEIYTFINNELKEILSKRGGKEGISVFVEQVRWLTTQYKVTAEEVLRLEAVLHEKLKTLDALHSRAPLLTSLDDHVTLAPLLEAFQLYATNIFKKSNITETYRSLFEGYKKWYLIRQILTSYQAMQIQEPRCSICLEGPVGYTVNPCGHTLCGECAAKMGSRCFLCRTEVKNKIRLYFG